MSTDLTIPSGVCLLCDGSGMRVVVRDDGSRAARECDCRIERRVSRMIARANIPKRYKDATLDNFEISHPTSTPSLKRAYRQARKFVDSYPLETRGTGLLFVGSVGVGKTFLAASILRALITNRGAEGVFYEYRELLKQIQNSYNPRVRETELEVLAPVFEAEVLVLDELGASEPTGWVSDTIAHILNIRYNECRTTIITTNYPNEPALGEEDESSAFPEERQKRKRRTLGDRIGERMRSRLQEMCVIVEIDAVDFRTTERIASFG
jgi:DNA replication protein DnaC